MGPDRVLRSAVFSILVGTAVIGFLACAPTTENKSSTPVPTTVENTDLRLRLVDLPTTFVVVANTDAELAVEPTDPAISGRVEFLVSPPEDGQNLISAMKFHQAFIENQEDGDYQGGQELVSQLGTAFYSRGRFVLDGEAIEETVVFTLHPDADRMLRLRYRYPAGVDSSVRVGQLFEVLFTVEGIESKAPQPGGSKSSDRDNLTGNAIFLDADERGSIAPSHFLVHRTSHSYR